MDEKAGRLTQSRRVLQKGRRPAMANRSTGKKASEGQVVIGVDVGDLWSEVCVLGEGAELVQELKVRTREVDLARVVSAWAPSLVVLEAGGQSPWISRLLGRHGHEALVVNPHRIRLIAASVNKTDRRDARLLAELGVLAPKMLARVQHRSEAEQADLAVLRARELLVKQRSMTILHVRGVLKAYGAKLEGVTVERFAERARLQVPGEMREALWPLLEIVSEQTKRIRSYDKQVARLIAEDYPEVGVLLQVPGVGNITALTFRLTIGAPERFRRSRQVGAYLGLTPGQRQSGGKDPELGITKAGDKAVRRLLVQCAQYILSHPAADSALREWGLKKAAGGKRARQRAVVAVARKLAVLLHRLWTTGEVYERYPGRAAPALAS